MGANLKAVKLLAMRQRCRCVNNWKQWGELKTQLFVKHCIEYVVESGEYVDKNDVNEKKPDVQAYLKSVEQNWNLEGEDLPALSAPMLKVMGIDHKWYQKQIVSFVKTMILGNVVQNEKEGGDGEQYGRMCLLCTEKPADMAFLACGHQCLCHVCHSEWVHTQNQQHCPTCRKPANQAIKVIISGF